MSDKKRTKVKAEYVAEVDVLRSENVRLRSVLATMKGIAADALRAQVPEQEATNEG